MAILDCLSSWFQCDKFIEEKEAFWTKKVEAANNTHLITKNQYEALVKEEEVLKDQLFENEHYRTIFDGMPDPHTIKVDKPSGVGFRTIIKNQLGERPTQFVTSDPNLVEYNVSGISNWRLPQELMKKLIARSPVKIFDENNGYNTNPALRFVAELNISLYWNVCVFAVRTKPGKWLVGFWPAEIDDKIMYADPVSNEMWIPGSTKESDDPELIFM